MSTDNNLLFVDDEINMLSMIKRNFISTKYNVFFASDAREALKIVKQREIKVIITDLQMPEINGMELVELLEKNYPNIVKIVLTGNHQITNILATVNHGNIFRFIIKPIDFKEELLPILEEACNIYDINQLKDKLLLEKQLGITHHEIPTNLLNSLCDSSLSYIDTISAIIKKAPFIEKDMLNKLLLDSSSRLEVIKNNTENIKKIVNKK